jgi:hypothetical protein
MNIVQGRTNYEEGKGAWGGTTWAVFLVKYNKFKCVIAYIEQKDRLYHYNVVSFARNLICDRSEREEFFAIGIEYLGQLIILTISIHKPFLMHNWSE